MQKCSKCQRWNLDGNHYCQVTRFNNTQFMADWNNSKDKYVGVKDDLCRINQLNQIEELDEFWCQGEEVR